MTEPVSWKAIRKCGSFSASPVLTFVVLASVEVCRSKVVVLGSGIVGLTLCVVFVILVDMESVASAKLYVMQAIPRS